MKRNARPDEAISQRAMSLVTRREAVLLAIVVTAGTLLRIVALSRSAVEHFDEGVYASNIFFGPPDYAYPLQRFFGPPLLPVLIEAGMIAGLPPNLAAMLPSFLAGCGTIVALWWFGRFWFGPPVGIAAAALAALSDFHIAYSATALTDVLLGLWLLLAIDAVGRSLVGVTSKRNDGTPTDCVSATALASLGDFRWAVGAGIFAGLAWWTKYNGWLPLAIEAAALPLLWIFLRPPGKQLRTWLGCFAVTVAVALALWAPYYFCLQSQGGYGPIAANHAKYFVGFTGWLDSAARQIANQYVFGVWCTATAVLASAAVPALLRYGKLNGSPWRCYGGFGAAIFGLYLVSVLVVPVGAAIGLARMLIAFHLAPKLDDAWRRRTIGCLLVLAWWGGMLVATPLYTPYPRLALPFVLASWIGMSLNFADFLDATEQRFYESKVGVFWAGAFLATIAVVLLLLGRAPPQIEVSSDRRGLLQIANQMRARDITHQPRAIYVFGEPAMYFQLRAAGEELVGPVENIPAAAAVIDGRAAPTFLIVGPHAQHDPQFQKQWLAAKERWELVQAFEYTPSAIVWLDLNDPRRSPPKERQPADEVRLFRLRR
jgi:dolichyl-phosphate-mannose-protein mannosyltransferase